MPTLLPPADEAWLARRPAMLAALAVLSWALFVTTLWVQSVDPEVVAAAAAGQAPEPPRLTWTTVLGLAAAYAVPMGAWAAGLRPALHAAALLCFLGTVVLVLSAATGFLWNWRMGIVPAAGVVVNLVWLLVAYRR